MRLIAFLITLHQDIEERRALKTDGTTPADNGDEPPSQPIDGGKDTGVEQDGTSPMLDPDVKPRRKNEDRRGSGKRKERRRADSKERGERGGQHHQVTPSFDFLQIATDRLC